ncbi:hypothetical protein HPB48_000280 [Haemaphysalis longicornis]|uniref:Uncharacterized protein n=1 Tax=Haemaphysalis longicornis TaxID=44386 RepID=A0A9J6GDR1_HAELO|nr:hypothetical protein HPB48_000280 [Haemaphysalis longicornis]
MLHTSCIGGIPCNRFQSLECYLPNQDDRDTSLKMHLWIAQRQKEGTRMVKWLSRLGHQLEDTVTNCRYARQDCTGRRYFTKSFDSRYGNCFCFHCHGVGGKDEDFLHEETATSTKEGLDLILDAQAEEYLPTSTQMGFVVMIHGQGFRPVLCNDVVFVEPGFVTYISLRLVT